MKHIKLFEDFVNEATTSWKKMMNAVKSSVKEHGRGTPWTLVAIDGRAVVGQKADIRTLEIIPAYYEEMRLQFPNAKIHIEDGTGAVIWSSK